MAFVFKIIAELADGTVKVGDQNHPVMKGVSASFALIGDEWCTFDKSPHPNVRVLSNVVESSYQTQTDIKGDRFKK